ncbi:hypothetical protein ABUK73_05835 [Agrobacterium sp. BA1120]|uniref:hypothetical protein n=1 Tax=Agrobacterium sp. BA1120 TaxID=3228927 RepID=UPI00336AD9DE
MFWNITPSFIFYMLFVLLTVGVLVSAHLLWIIQYTTRIWRLPNSKTLKIAKIALIIVTPILSFYAIEAWRYFQMPSSERPAPDRRYFIVPIMVVLLTGFGAINGTIRRSSVEDVGWLHGLEGFATLLGWYIALYLPYHMLAKLLTISHRGPLLSRVNALPIAVFAGLYFIP